MRAVLQTAVTLAFISAISDTEGQSVLTAVQLLWVNLIMDTMAALALATESPTPELLNRPPHGKSEPLISFLMWRMVIGEAIFQVRPSFVATSACSLGGRRADGHLRLLPLPSLRIQITVNLVLLYLGPTIFNLEPVDGNTAQTEINREINRTIVFNTFVFMQIFNEINCRRIDQSTS